jgi:hypothetical protein
MRRGGHGEQAVMGSGFSNMVWADRDSKDAATANESGSVMPWPDEKDLESHGTCRQGTGHSQLDENMTSPMSFICDSRSAGENGDCVPKEAMPWRPGERLLPLILHKLNRVRRK